MKKIIPRGQYVLIKPESVDAQKNEYGLLIPSAVDQEQKAIGEVLAVGNDVKDIKKGETGIYGVFAGETIKMKEGSKEVEYKLVHQEDIIGFVK